MSKYSNITTPFKIGTLNLKNRLVFAPMVTNLANPDGTISDELIEFIKARAKGGVGLIITENTAVNQAGRLFPNTRIDKDEFIPGLTSLFEVIHNEGVKVFIQLDHEGRETTYTATKGKGPLAPSPIPSPTFKETPREMTIKEIEETIEDFVKASIRAKKAGADGVELQGAHGFLIHQFLSPRTNKRNDIYGKDIEGRTLFLVKIIERIKESVGKDFIICCRINCEDFVEGGLTLKETIPIAKLIEKAGADIIHVSAGVLESVEHICPPKEFPDCVHVELCSKIKEAVNIPVITVGKIPNLESAESIIKNGKADMVAYARPLLADQEWINKELSGNLDEIVRCERCNSCLSKILSKEPKIACKLHKKGGSLNESTSLA